MTITSPLSIEKRLADIEARQASAETRDYYMEAAIQRIEDDSRFLRRSAWTALIGVISTGGLALLSVILRALGKL
jgi:hypothetical protein